MITENTVSSEIVEALRQLKSGPPSQHLDTVAQLVADRVDDGAPLMAAMLQVALGNPALFDPEGRTTTDLVNVQTRRRRRRRGGRNRRGAA